jgi:hypothetical protein
MHTRVLSLSLKIPNIVPEARPTALELLDFESTLGVFELRGTGGVESPRGDAARSARTACYTYQLTDGCQPESRLLPGTS